MLYSSATFRRKDCEWYPLLAQGDLVTPPLYSVGFESAVSSGVLRFLIEKYDRLFLSAGAAAYWHPHAQTAVLLLPDAALFPSAFFLPPIP